MSQQTTTDAGHALPDPVELASRYAEIAQRASNLMVRHFEKQSREGFSVPSDDLGISKAFTDLSASVRTNPYQLAEAQMTLLSDHVALWRDTTAKMRGLTPLPPIATQTSGSWWPDWQQWVSSLAGGTAQVPARQPGAGKLKAIKAAPGSCVKRRLGQPKV